MRWHHKLFMLGAVAALAAGCSNSDRPAENNGATITGPNASLASCETFVGDRVFLDANCNGVQDGGETGVAGVTVRLYTCEGRLMMETTTDANGNYGFSGFQDDEYKLWFDLPAGHTFSPKDQGGADAYDSDVNPDGYTDCFLTECDKPNSTKDAGLCGEVEECETSVGDRVFLDGNCDGIQDAEEGGVPGVGVHLYTCGGELVGSTTTDANGLYEFSGIDEGSYKVCFELPDGSTWSPKDQGGADAADSDVNSDGCTDCFTVECDKPNNTVDAGICEEKGGGEGCTPGFWRNHLDHWGPTGFTPDMLVNDVFGCDLVDGDVTLGEAIDAPQTYGALVFHAIAGILNAAHPDVDYAHSVGDVIDFACEGDKDSISEENERGCPLSGGNTTGGGNPNTTGLKLRK